MDWIVILQAGVASGTVLLFATVGEILAERSGVMNLGVEGMMPWAPWPPNSLACRRQSVAWAGRGHG